MQAQQSGVHQHHGHQGLQHTDDGGLPAGLLQLGQAELVADGKGNEAQSHRGDDAQVVYGLQRGKAQASDVQRSQPIGADGQTGDEKGGDVGKIEVQLFENTGHQQSGHQGDGHGDQLRHKETPLDR